MLLRNTDIRSVILRNLSAIKTVLVLALLVPALGACGNGGFQPLYGTNSNGTNVQDELAAINIVPIPGRVGQVLRNELIFKTTGGDYAAPSEYRLEIAVRESVSTQLVQVDADAQSSTFNLDAEYKLIRLTDNEIVLKGKDHTRAAYQRFNEILSNVRAMRDAENRAAKHLAVSLRTRLAAFLSSTG